MVDWGLARTIARFAAGSDQPVASGSDLVALSGEMEPLVAGYTRLRPAAPVPPAEVVGRARWAELNLDTLARMLDPVAERLERRLAFAGPLAGALRVGAGATLAAEAGLVMGYASQRVLGQYELSLLQPESPPRLLYVGPNLERAVRDLAVDRQGFLRWVAAHELTHVFQFQGVPWLREHMAGLLRRYLATVDVRIERGSAGGLPTLPEPARLVEAFREGGLVALIQTSEQRALMREMQALMAVIEGYSEHVMDALGAEHIPGYAELRRAMDRRRRSRSAPERILQRLLGLDLKLQQYELGKRFCDAVAGERGVAVLNRVWDSPQALPSGDELSHPERWLERSAGTAPAPA
jgi:coenzyme F420 biosynthesis associated uncharacterized protein